METKTFLKDFPPYDVNSMAYLLRNIYGASAILLNTQNGLKMLKTYLYKKPVTHDDLVLKSFQGLVSYSLSMY